MILNIDDDTILPIITAILAITITLCDTFCILQSTYDEEATVLSDKIAKLYKENDQLTYQNHILKDGDPGVIKFLQLQLKLVEDGASIEEARLIVEQSTEVGIDPKL